MEELLSKLIENTFIPVIDMPSKLPDTAGAYLICAKNIGIWSFYIIKLQDDTDPQFAYRGDDKFTPGINFNKKNVIPDEHS